MMAHSFNPSVQHLDESRLSHFFTAFPSSSVPLPEGRFSEIEMLGMSESSPESRPPGSHSQPGGALTRRESLAPAGSQTDEKYGIAKFKPAVVCQVGSLL
jgi:hypothetical protein